MTDARFPAHTERISISQGRNDVRDARADVTDMRAPSRTQNVRRKNRAFDLDEENRVRHRPRRRLETTRGPRRNPTPWPDPTRPYPSRTPRAENRRVPGRSRRGGGDGTGAEAVGGTRREAPQVLANREGLVRTLTGTSTATTMNTTVENVRVTRCARVMPTRHRWRTTTRRCDGRCSVRTGAESTAPDGLARRGDFSAAAVVPVHRPKKIVHDATATALGCVPVR